MMIRRQANLLFLFIGAMVLSCLAGPLAAAPPDPIITNDRKPSLPPNYRVLPELDHCPSEGQAAPVIGVGAFDCNLSADDLLLTLAYTLRKRDSDARIIVETETLFLEDADAARFPPVDAGPVLLSRSKITAAPCFIAPVSVNERRWSAVELGVRHIARELTVSELFGSRCVPPPEIWDAELANDRILWRLVVMTLNEMARLAGQLGRIDRQSERLSDLFGSADRVNLIENPYLDQFNQESQFKSDLLLLAEASKIFLANAKKWTQRENEDAFGRAILDRWHSRLRTSIIRLLERYKHYPRSAPNRPDRQMPIYITGTTEDFEQALKWKRRLPIYIVADPEALASELRLRRRYPYYISGDLKALRVFRPDTTIPVIPELKPLPGPPRPFADFNRLEPKSPTQRVADLSAILRQPILQDDAGQFVDTGP